MTQSKLQSKRDYIPDRKNFIDVLQCVCVCHFKHQRDKIYNQLVAHNLQNRFLPSYFLELSLFWAKVELVASIAYKYPEQFVCYLLGPFNIKARTGFQVQREHSQKCHFLLFPPSLCSAQGRIRVEGNSDCYFLSSVANCFVNTPWTQPLTKQ